jgi:hypothetical protein
MRRAWAGSSATARVNGLPLKEIPMRLPRKKTDVADPTVVEHLGELVATRSTLASWVMPSPIPKRWRSKLSKTP